MSLTQRQFAERLKAVKKAAKGWEERLLDESQTPLRNYRDYKRSTIDMTPSDESGVNLPALESLLSGKEVRLTRLFQGEDAQQDARRRLSVIYRTAQTNSDEKGIDTLFAAAGLATWDVGTGSTPNAPVILIPLELSPANAARSEFTIKASGDPHINPVLAHILKSEYNLDISDENDNIPADLSFSALTNLLKTYATKWDKQVSGFAIKPRVVVGNFRYTNMAMVNDLADNIDALARNDVVAAIAGVKEARDKLAANISNAPFNKPDIDPPESEYLILDADSSQHNAINRALSGESLVVWGPPGTGKSQVIANLIAALIADGKRVLFVAAKRAAIDVVTARLDSVGLSELVMDAHSGIGSKREFAQKMDASLRGIKGIPKQDYADVHSNLARTRDRLITHRDNVHDRRDPWGISVFEIQSKIIGMPEAAQTDLRIQRAKARNLNTKSIERLKEDAKQWIELDGHKFRANYPEWDQSKVKTSEEARAAFDLVRELAEILPDVHSQLIACLGEVGLTPPDAVYKWRNLLEWLSDVEQFSTQFRSGIYELEHEACVAALRRRLPMVSLFSSRYRNALKSVQATQRIQEMVSAKQAIDAVEQAKEHLRKWNALNNDGSFPRTPSNLKEIRAKVNSLADDLIRLADFLPKLYEISQTYTALTDMLQTMAGQLQAVSSLPEMRRLERRFERAGVAQIVRSASSETSPEYIDQAIEYSWLNAVWEDLNFQNSELNNFKSATHNLYQRGFVKADHQHIDASPKRILRKVAEAATQKMNDFPDEHRLVRHESAKKSKLLPVRELFRRAPNVITAIRPCWAMSPLLVAETISADANMFDVVIFDEASQIPPEEAICSLARAPQAIIAGDHLQLPPTNFFSNDQAAYSSSSAALTTGTESILDVARAGLVRDAMLNWHYRSRDARLIAFSNVHIYEGNLTAFPGVAVKAPFTHHLVPPNPSLPLKTTNSHPDEVAKVVDLIIEHARECPDETLGVIAFGLKHADSIEEALRVRLRDMADSSLDKFFSATAQERFFVKNIETVQGDERDVIILSVGYHKDARGRLLYRFGPLNQDGGERRLNVAVTRARSRIHLVSSFSHQDMEPGRSKARGVELLRQYLEFAASGGSELGAAVSEEPLNPFEMDVKQRLERAKIPLTPQYGVAGYRIDFACAHPKRAGDMVLAIEADGASYHSGHTARDRDRLRQDARARLPVRGWGLGTRLRSAMVHPPVVA